MAKTRPPAGRPPQRRGKSGVGPGPGYRPNPNTGGTKHGKSSSSAQGPVAGIVFALSSLALLLVGTPVVYLAWSWIR